MERTGQFRFTGIVWHEIPMEKSIDNFNALEDLLNAHLDLRNYGDELDYLFFVFLIHLPNQKIHTEFHRFYRQKRYLDFQLKLDYFEVLAAPPEDVKAMMETI